MIYPSFTIINPKHKDFIDSVTKNFPPYCDFQFSNLLSWSSSKYPTKVASLDGNLVIKMKEYSTNKTICMFMGTTNTVESLKKLLYHEKQVERIPEEVIKEIQQTDSKSYFEISEDINNDDYVLDLNNISLLEGNKFKSKRKNVRAFKKYYPTHTIKLIDPNSTSAFPLIGKFFMDIANEKKESIDKLEDELEAIDRLLKCSTLFDLNIITVMYEGNLIGFTINEILSKSPYSTALGCFGKGLRKYKGIYAYLELITANHLLKQGLKFINIEEDMGMGGLRQSKILWRPTQVLKKYIVKQRG